MSLYFDIIDTETAGLQGGVVEFAHLRVNMTTLEVMQELVERVNPERPIDPGAFAIHGISDDDVKDCPTIAEVTAYLSGQQLQWAGHNASFDRRMLQEVLTAERELCTLALSRQYIKGTTNHKLATLKAELGFPEQKSHSALGDCYTTLDLIKFILPMTGVDLETLWLRANEPKLLSKMPYGKHKGKSMVSVPREYREWLRAQEGLDKDMKFTLDKLSAI